MSEDYQFNQVNITILHGKTFKGFTKVNPVSDYRKLLGDAFEDCTLIPF